MKLHLPKSLFVAVVAAMVSSTAWADDGYDSTTDTTTLGGVVYSGRVYNWVGTNANLHSDPAGAWTYTADDGTTASCVKWNQYGSGIGQPYDFLANHGQDNNYASTTSNYNFDTLHFTAAEGVTKNPNYSFNKLRIAGIIVDANATGYTVKASEASGNRHLILGNSNTTVSRSSIGEDFTLASTSGAVGTGSSSVTVRGTQEWTIATGKTFTLNSGGGVKTINGALTISGGTAKLAGTGATTISGTVTLNNSRLSLSDTSATFSDSGSLTLNNSTLNVDGALTVADANKLVFGTGTNKITGAGRIEVNNTTHAALSGKLSDSETWTGTLTLNGVTASNLDLANYANSNSTVELTGVSGHLSNWNNGETSVNIKLTDNGNTKALTINNGGSGTFLKFSGSLTGSGTFNFTSGNNPQKYSDPIFTGDITGFSGTFYCPNAVFSTGNTDIKDSGEGVLQFGEGGTSGKATAAYSANATADESGIIRNIAGSGTIDTTSVVRFNYLSDARYTALGVDNSSISARYIDFNHDGGTADYIVTAAITGKNPTARNNTLAVSGATTTLKGQVTRIGNVLVKEGAALVVAEGAALTNVSNITNQGSITINGTLDLSGADLQRTILNETLPTEGENGFTTGTTIYSPFHTGNAITFGSNAVLTLDGQAFTYVYDAEHGGYVTSDADVPTAHYIVQSGTEVSAVAGAQVYTVKEGSALNLGSATAANVTGSGDVTSTMTNASRFNFDGSFNGEGTFDGEFSLSAINTNTSATGHSNSVVLNAFSGTVKLAGRYNTDQTDLGDASKLVLVADRSGSITTGFWGERAAAFDMDVEVESQNGNYVDLYASSTMTFNGSVSGDKLRTQNGSTITFNGAVDLADLTVKDNAITFAQSSTIGSLTVESNKLITVQKDLTISGGAETTIKNLTLSDGASVTLGSAEEHDSALNVTTLTVQGEASMNANLVMAENGTINSAATLTMGCTVTLKAGETLVITMDGLDLQTDMYTLFSGVDALTLGGMNAAANTWYDADTVFSTITVNGEELDIADGAYQIGLWGTDVLVTSATVAPEPATATLSLLALAGLCARRRRR